MPQKRLKSSCLMSLRRRTMENWSPQIIQKYYLSQELSGLPPSLSLIFGPLGGEEVRMVVTKEGSSIFPATPLTPPPPLPTREESPTALFHIQYSNPHNRMSHQIDPWKSILRTYLCGSHSLGIYAGDFCYNFISKRENNNILSCLFSLFLFISKINFIRC